MKKRVTVTILAPFLLLHGSALGSDLSLEVLPSVELQELDATKLLELNPNLDNPHRVRWFVDRSLGLARLEAVDLKPGQVHSGDVKAYGARVGSVVARSTIYIRRSDSYYQPIEKFPCTTVPDPRFATREGSLLAGRKSVHRWNELVQGAIPRLASRLAAVRGEFPTVALRKAGEVFETWKEDVFRAWTRKMKSPEFLRAEWEVYARERDCKALQVSASSSLPSWVEQAQEPRPEAQRPIARASARRWDQQISLRLEIAVGDTSLNGVFLFDPSVERTQVSPNWLQSQGVLARWLAKGSSDVARIDGAKIAGVSVPLRYIDVRSSEERYYPPQFAAVCCDGVLGRDVIRNFAWEYRPASVTESAVTAPQLTLWPRGSLPPASSGQEWSLEEAFISEKGRFGFGQMDRPWILDLTRGSISRIRGPAQPPTPRIRIEYAYDQGDRLARVVAVQQKGEKLPPELTPGTWLTEIMGYPVSRFDTWEAMRLLNSLPTPVSVVGRKSGRELLITLPGRTL